MSQEPVRNVIVIGSGPAGHTAAIYAARANLKPLMFEGLARGGIPGGQLMITNDVENYPGFPEKVAGPELMSAFRQQSLDQGVEIRTEDVTRVDLRRAPWTVWAGEDGTTRIPSADVDHRDRRAGQVARARERDGAAGQGRQRLRRLRRRVLPRQEVLVVGGGDTAMEEAMYLSGMCASVTLVHRRESFRASKTMQARVAANPKIRIFYNTVVDEVLDVRSGGVTGARLRHVRTRESQVIPCTGFFVAIGHTPNTDLFEGQLELHDNGYIRTRPGSTQTSVPGVFACGDVQDFTYRQAVTAAGSGCMAALDAERWMALEGPAST